MKPLTSFVCVVLGLVACRDASGPNPPSDNQPQDLSVKVRPPKQIPGQYIVVFRDDVRVAGSMATALVGKHHGKLKRTYTAALNGMAIEIPDSAVAALRRDPAVAFVEQNQEVYAVAEPIVQRGPPVGLDRIDQRFLPLSGTYSYSSDGAGAQVYILDTGINFGHSDFGGRAVLGYDAIGTDGRDCNGHGTHVAGTVGTRSPWLPVTRGMCSPRFRIGVRAWIWWLPV
jgi:subtilisin family serine protease